jgi:hypothetical protein
MKNIRLKKLAGLLNEDYNQDSIQEAGANYSLHRKMVRDIEDSIAQYNEKKKIVSRARKEMKLTLGKNVAKKIADSHLVGKTLEELSPGFEGNENYDVPIKRVKSAEFTIDNSQGLDVQDGLVFHVELELENGKTLEHDWYPADLFAI